MSKAADELAKNDMMLHQNNIHNIEDIINPNEVIKDSYEHLAIVNQSLKDIKSDITEKLNEDDEILLLSHEIEEANSKLKPKKELLKTKKEELKNKNIELYKSKLALETQKKALMNKITRAVMKKQELKDTSPIIVMQKDKQKKLIINLSPRIKKEKVD